MSTATLYRLEVAIGEILGFKKTLSIKDSLEMYREIHFTHILKGKRYSSQHIKTSFLHKTKFYITITTTDPKVWVY